LGIEPIHLPAFASSCSTLSSPLLSSPLLDRVNACVILSNMKTATIRQVQHNLAEVLSCVARGEEVAVLRRGKIVAKLVPPSPRASATPDVLARAEAVWGKAPKGRPLSEAVSSSRDDG
jgi:antitoxin (DNA-binding transcriptional repressor) of toxin-antitoxin stability system